MSARDQGSADGKAHSNKQARSSAHLNMPPQDEAWGDHRTRRRMTNISAKAPANRDIWGASDLAGPVVSSALFPGGVKQPLRSRARVRRPCIAWKSGNQEQDADSPIQMRALFVVRRSGIAVSSLDPFSKTAPSCAPAGPKVTSIVIAATKISPNGKALQASQSGESGASVKRLCRPGPRWSAPATRHNQPSILRLRALFCGCAPHAASGRADANSAQAEARDLR